MPRPYRAMPHGVSSDGNSGSPRFRLLLNAQPRSRFSEGRCRVSVWRGPPTRRRRQPQIGNIRRAFQIAPAAFLFRRECPLVSGPSKKEDPGTRRARVYRRMGEGLGAGGHATRRQTLERVCRRFVPSAAINFSSRAGTSPIAKRARTRHLRCALRNRGRFSASMLPRQAPRSLAAGRARRCAGVSRQVQMLAVGKFEIARRHSQTTASAAAAFDHVARAHGKSIGQATGLRAH
jgi:hypothetical protein